MKTYHGERTELGCEVTVDGEPLLRRSDLTGNASNALDWGFIGTGQLSMAILSDFFRDDIKAKAMCAAFDQKVIAELPHQSWTLTGRELMNALKPLALTQRVSDPSEIEATNASVGDIAAAAQAAALTSIAAVGIAAEDAAQKAGEYQKSLESRAADLKAQVGAAGEMRAAAKQVAAAATAVGNAAHQLAHANDQPADEPMSTVNRAADAKAAATNRVVDAAADLARSAVAQADRVVSKLQG